MASIINPDTFAPAAEQPGHGYWVAGTVEVTIGRETRRVAASIRDNEITAKGLTGRYQTGAKAWPATVTRVIDPSNGRPWDRVQFGRDERANRCKKTSMVFFAA